MNYRRLAVLLTVLVCPGLANAGAPELGPADRVLLGGYARDTWKSFEALAMPSGLPADSITKTADGWSTAYYTSPSDIAAYLWSTMAAEDLKIITAEESKTRIARTLGKLVTLERSHGFFLNWYDPRDGSTLKTWPGGGKVSPFLSTVDNGWLAVSLIMVRNARPGFREPADDLLKAMDFGFFYDKFDPTDPIQHPGLLRGGFNVEDNTFASYHYGMLNTEARIASYVGIALGQLPRDHYYRLSRFRPPGGEARPPTCRGEVRSYQDVPVQEGYNSYRGLRVVPSWDGSMFEALMVNLFIPEAEWAPKGWGVNHPLYVRASIEYSMADAHLAAWGASPSSVPGGGYKVFGVTPLSVDGRRGETAGDTVMTPHASFLALPFAPREALDNIEVLASKFHAYGPHGFLDAVDVTSGKLSNSELVLDQGMIMAAVANVLSENSVQKAFCDGKVAQVIRPLIEPEAFSSGLENREVPGTTPGSPGWQRNRTNLPSGRWNGPVALSKTLGLTLKTRVRPAILAFEGSAFGD